MKKKLIASILLVLMLLTGPLGSLITVAAQEFNGPTFTINEMFNDGITLKASIAVESGSFSALNLKFSTVGLECTAIEQGSALVEAQNAEENPVSVTASTNISITGEGKSNISFACSPEYDVVGELYVVTFSITSIKEYSFNIECLKCYQYQDSTYKKVIPSIQSEVSFDKTTFDKTTYLRYSVNNGEATITGCNTLMFHKFEIPETLGGYPVKYIAASAFENCRDLTEITVPDTVVGIGQRAFYNCSSLEIIDLPDNIISIGQNAFYNTSFYNNSDSWKNSVFQSEQVLYLENYLIQAKNISSGYEIEAGTSLIADYAFYNCRGLESITIPDSITTIGSYAFYYCTGLENVTVPNSVISIGNSAFSYCTGLKSVAISESVTAINQSLFENCTSLESVTIPDGVTAINNYAFRNCTGLKTVTFPDSITSIGSYAFYYCTGLENVTVPNSVISIGNSAFSYCTGLKSVAISESVTAINQSLFENCTSLESVTIPDGVTAINNYAFRNCTGLKTVTFPDSITTIGSYAFYYCTSLENVTVPNSVTSIGNSAFSYCTGLKSVAISESVTAINQSLFENCTSLESVTIPDGVTAINNYAFRNCTGLRNVTIPSTVTYIRNYAFHDCTNLEVTYFKGSKEQWDSISVYSYNEPLKTKVVYEYGTESAYMGKGTCGDGLTWIVLCDGTLRIDGSGAMTDYLDFSSVPWEKHRSSIKSLIISEGVTNISGIAFSFCENLTNILVDPDNQFYCSDSFGALYNKDKTELIRYPSRSATTSFVVTETIASINEGAFYGCINLEEIVVDSDNPYYSSDSYGVLYNKDKTELIRYPSRSAITSFVVAETIASINEGAFYGCINLEEIVVDSDNPYYSSDSYGVLYNKDKTKLIQYPAGSERTRFDFPSSVITVVAGAFSFSENLVNVYYNGNRDNWNELEIEENNEILTYANIHFVFVGNVNSDNYINSSDALLVLQYSTGLIDSLECDTKYADINYDSEISSVDALYILNVATGMITDIESDEIKTVQSETEAVFSIRKVSKSENNITYDIILSKGNVNAIDIKFVTEGLECVSIENRCNNYGPMFISNPSETTRYNISTVCINGISGNATIARVFCQITDESYSFNIEVNGVVVNENAYVTETLQTKTEEYDPLKGYCGNDVFWLFNPTTGELTISGTGPMNGFTSDDRPWEYFIKEINSVSIGEGITNIGDFAFYYCYNLKYIVLGSNVEAIGYRAFYSLASLKHVFYRGDEEIVDSISMSSGNDVLLNCAHHFSVTGDAESLVSIEKQQGTCVTPESINYICSLCDEIIHSEVLPLDKSAHNFIDGVCEFCSFKQPEDIYVDEFKLVTIENSGDSVYFSFVPETSGVYYFFADTDYSTKGRLYNKNMNYLDSYRASGKSSPSGWHSGDEGYLCYELTGGETYYIQFSYDSDWCGEFYVMVTENFVSRHTQEKILATIQPTCTNSGYTRCYCAFCGGEYEKDEVDALGHVQGDLLLTVEPSCDRQGYSVYNCERCHESYKTDYTESLEHKMTEQNVEATCITDGGTKRVCTVCGYFTIGDVTETATGHNYVDGTCTNCGWDEDFEYEILENGIAVTGYNGDDDNVVIPSELCGYSVIEIADYAFDYSHFSSVIIPDTVKMIGWRAFYSCDNLETIAIPDGVEIIDGQAFYSCDSLTSVYIGEGITIIGDYAFDSCYNLESITVSEENTMYSSDENGVLFNKDKTVLIKYPAGNDAAEYVIPDTVKTIGWGAFDNCDNIETISIPDSVEIIDGQAFESCDSLTSVYIGKGITIIGDYAFGSCYNLESITVNEENTMYSSDENGVLFNKDKTVLIKYPAGNDAAEYVIPDTVKTIGWGAFYGCSSLETVVIPDSVEIIDGQAFESCDSLTSVYIGKGITIIGDYAFGSCNNLESIAVSEENTMYSSDENGVLFNKDKTVLINYPAGNDAAEYVIPDTVKTIDNRAFYDCDNIETITIPVSVNIIGTSAFSWCARLKSVFIDNGVTTIGEYAFDECYNLESVVIGDGVETISNHAFSSCYDLKYLVIGSGVKRIDDYAFGYDRNLKHIFYRGDEESVAAIVIGEGNEALTNSACHYSITGDIDELVAIETVPATCVEEGSIKHTCALCNEVLYSVNHKVDKSAHNYVDGVCEYCSLEQPKDINIDELTLVEIKNPGDSVYFRFVPETSGVYYFYSDSQYDTYGYLYDEYMNYLVTDDDGGEEHNFLVSYDLVAGKTYYFSARYYDSSYTDTFYVKLSQTYTSGHSYELVEHREPSCSTDGYDEYICCVCGMQKTVDLPRLEHSFEEQTAEATCLTPSGTKRVCTVCGYFEFSEATDPATGHNYVDGICTSCGWDEDFEYEILDNGIAITGYNGNDDHVVIPSECCGYEVVVIGGWAFEDCDFSSVEIPDTVKTIGYCAFYSCNNLETVIIPDSVEVISMEAFSNCTSLTSVYIGKGVTTIDWYAFGDCPNFENITVSADNAAYSSDENGILFNKDRTVLIKYPDGKTATSYTIPDTVTTIGSYAFCKCYNLETVTIPDSVKTIEIYAFFNCYNLKNVTIPDSVEIIGEYAFADCYGLKHVVIGSGIKQIYDYAFYCCYDLESITVSADNAMYSSDEHGVLFNKDKTQLIQYPVGNERTEYTIPNSVTSIGDYAFEGCKGLKGVTISDSVTSIGYGAFSGCYSLTSVTIGNGVKIIGEYAFSYCYALRYVVMGSGINRIDENAFDCDYYNHLTHVFYRGDEESVAAIVIDEGNEVLTNCTCHYSVTGDIDELVTIETIPATCVEEGSVKHTCALCNEVLYSVNLKVDKSAHNYVDGVCENCSVKQPEDINLDEFTLVEIKNPGESVYFRFIPETSGEYYFFADTKYSTWGHLYNSDMSELSYYINSGFMSDDEYVDTTHDGYMSYNLVAGKTYYISFSCYDDSYVADFYAMVTKNFVSRHTEEHIIKIVQPTCMNEGYTSCYCSVCGAEYTKERVAALGHQLTEQTVEATCITDGGTKRVCTVCGYFEFSEATDPATGHNYVDGICTSCGWDEDFDYQMLDNGIAITGYNGNDDHVVIPSECCGYEVIKIVYEAFYNCNNIETVTIPDSVEIIEDRAFAECNNLKYVVMGSGIKRIGYDTFGGNNSNLKHIFYRGDEESFAAFVLGEGNHVLRKYTCHCSVTGDIDELVARETVPATCTEPGSNVHKCTICNEVIWSEYISVTHSYDIIETTQATCTQPSYNVYKCRDCGAEYTEQASGVLDHVIADGHCTRCDMVISEIKLNELTDVNITVNGEKIYFSFTPETDGTYYFYSDSAYDTYGYLYDSDMNELASGDYYEDGNFVIEYDLIAGQTYYIVSRYYSSYRTGNFKVKVSTDFTSNHTYRRIASIPVTCTREGVDVYECDNCGVQHEVYIESIGSHNYVNGVCEICGCHEDNHILDLKPQGDTTAVIDAENKLIYGISSGTMLWDLIYYYLSICDGIEADFDYNSLYATLGTGSTVTFISSDETTYEYTIVIFGDVNGDGWYDGMDAVIVSCLANGMLTKDDVSEAVWMAADCNHDGVIDQLDVDLLNQAGALLANVDQSKTADVLLETSSEYVEYISLIDQSPEIEIEDDTDAKPDIPESDNSVENEPIEPDTEDSTQQGSVEFSLIDMIINFIKSIFEMLLAYILVPIK